ARLCARQGERSPAPHLSEFQRPHTPRRRCRAEASANPESPAESPIPDVASHALLLEKSEELLGLGEREETLGHIRFLAELCDLPQIVELLIGNSEPRRNFETEEIHPLLIEGPEIHAICLATKGDS